MKPDTCYWDENTASMVGNRINKIREYLRNKLITPYIPEIKDKEGNLIEEERPEVPNMLYVMPGEGRHQVHMVDISLWTCTCQAYNSNGKDCSHIYACKLFLDQVNQQSRDYDEGKKRLLQEKEDLEKPKGPIFGDV